jgi:hypothetical protein
MLDVARFCAFLSIGDPVGIGLEPVASSLSVRLTPEAQKKTTWLTVPTSVVKTPIGWGPPYSLRDRRSISTVRTYATGSQLRRAARHSTRAFAIATRTGVCETSKRLP